MYKMFEYLLPFLDIDGHTEEAAGANIMEEFLAHGELHSLLGGQHLLQSSESDIYILSELSACGMNKNSLTNSWFHVRVQFLWVAVEILAYLCPPSKDLW